MSENDRPEASGGGPEASRGGPEATTDGPARSAQPATGPAKGPEAGSPPRSRGLPTGLKLLFGCLGVVALGLIVLAVAVGVGGFALKRGIESTVGGVEEHREASEVLGRLERDHPFEPPSDGAVTEQRLRRFLAVTDRAWEGMRPWADEIRELRERSASGEQPRLRDALTGARAVGGMGRSRLALAGALEGEGMSLGEYAWTGLTLSRAVEAAGGGAASGVPEENRRLAARYEAELAPLEREDGPGLALAVAVFWGLSEAPTWRALGLDTLAAAAR